MDLFLRKAQPALCQESWFVTTDCFYDKSSSRAGNTEVISIANPARATGTSICRLPGYSALR